MKKTTYEMNSKNNIQRHFLRPLIIALAMITAVPLALQGQETFTGEGLYYISTKGILTQAYDTSNHANNFYLCPSVNWYYYQSFSPYYTNTYNGMPFLTTYKCQGNQSYNANSAIWIIKESDTDGYYHFIRAIDGKYLTFNEAMGNGSNVGRMRVHLQDTPDGAKARFKINYISGSGKNCYDIISFYSAQDNRKYINVTDGNQNSLQASGKTDGPNKIATGGIIGLWNKGSNDNENTSKWTFEAATKLPAPIVTQTSLGHYEITPDAIFNSLPTGYTIKFSTDGSVVDENSENYTPGSTIEITTSGTLIASIWAHGMEITQQVVQTVSAGIETPTFNVHCDNSLELSCGSLGAGIKYVINDNEPTHCTIEYTNPITTGLHDGDIVYARSYIGSDYSNVEQFTYYTNTADPTVTLTDNSANLTFSGTADIYYTTNGQDPVIDKNGIAGSGTTMLDNQTNTASITISSDNDVELHIVAKQANRGYSCPVTVVKRPKRPTISATTNCYYGGYRAHELTFTNTEIGKTYWYALSNGSGQTPPATNTFIEYTPGETVEITSIPGYNPSSATVTLHAYAKDAEGNISVIKSQDYSLDYTPAPTFSYSNNTITITAETGATINYSVNGVNQSDATTSATVNVSIGTNVIVVATATLGSSNPSCEVTYRVSRPISITDLAGLNGMTLNLNGVYRLDADIEDASSYTSKGTEENPFTGTFDGNGHTINGLTQPLFGVVNGGVVKNMTLKGVNINSSADNVGAIAGVVEGYSRIFNCGILPNSADFPDGQNSHPKVKTTGSCAGGLVGSLRDNSRVVNCFSYADVTATDYAAGIVGRNTYASTAAVSGGKYTNLRTMVVNCMFYGDILGGTNQYGVYGDKLITNDATTGISNYNYFRNGTRFTAANGHKNTNGGSNVVGNPTAYNCSFPAEERYLTQVEFHRSLLNSNRELCGWWIGSDVAPSTLTTAQVQAIPKDASLIYKWVVDPNIAPYPILKPFGKYPSVVNGNTGTPWFDREAANEYEGKKLGTLSVTVKSGVHSSAADQTLTIPITDMDTLHYDFCYRKVQLPYFNTVFGNPNSVDWTTKYAGNYKDYVVTGWKVTAVTGGTQGTFLADWQYGYNFADRKCTDKDLYSVSDRVFAQGGNYYVPDGVTAITIEAYWGKAIYVCDDSYSYDRVNITVGNTGTHFAPAGTRDNSINGYTVYNTKIRDVIDNITEKHTVYDHAIVLVGNVQESNGNNPVTVNTNNTIGFTIMSVDLDFDEEPDYCLEWQLGTGTDRNAISPVRFDFLPVVELGIAGKLNESQNFFSLGCFRSCGHFEVTETAFIRFGQFEFERKTRDEGPVILNGGIYDQYTRGTKGDENTNNNQHINYVILGGHVVMPSFTPGAHVNENANYTTRHCAVNALGGDFTSFYLTGGYNEAIAPYDDNPHCYIDGGHFGTIAAAYKEGIAGNVTWRINHALIGEFYGGGVMSQKEGTYKIVKGDIDVVIDSSIVGKYCGGPKFGDMVEGKTVTTSATGTIFGYYYGAGNGGTNYVQYASTDAVGSPYSVNTWNNTVNDNYHPNQYRESSATKAPKSYEADYEYEQINTSTGTTTDVVNRSYYYSAQFATTNTGNVKSTLTGCTVLNNFYGAGFLGGVTGTVTSTLTDTRVMGSAFGAGYSASSGTVTIHNKDKNTPVVNMYTGMITYNPEGTSTTYNWTDKTSIGGHPLSTSEPEATYEDKNYFYTEISLDNLGAVSKDVVLTINGNSEIGGNVGGGNVFGGGDQSAVNGNATVKIQGNAKIHGNVYGGGNKGTIGGNASVEIK